MDALMLSRIQFGLTIGFHYIFPPLTIGLAGVLVILGWMRLTRDDSLYERMMRFWVKLFAINFAIGVATGIVMEFEFGTNWSNYSKYVGDIFGAPLAAEAIFSFFLESSFLAILVYGWDKVSKRVHFISACMVSLGSLLSAFWIIVANSWQQTPAGFKLATDASGKVVRAELTDFMAAVFNPSTMPRYVHTLAGAFTVAAFVVGGISAWYLVKGIHLDFAKKSLAIAIIIGVVATVGSAVAGDWHARQVALTQPEKFAAMEGLFKTQTGAPFLILGYPLPDLGINKLLSVMVYFDPNAEVKGLDAFPPEDLPPVMFTAISFHAMIWPGVFCLLFMIYGAYLLWRGKLYGSTLYLKTLFWLIPLPYLLNEIGWFTAEVGRQPWAVYHLLRTADGYSPTVPGGQILFTIVLFSIIYIALFALGFFLVRRLVLAGPDPAPVRKGGKA
jgi:cytochrome d ubiquinol oxidase subunit I